MAVKSVAAVVVLLVVLVGLKVLSKNALAPMLCKMPCTVKECVFIVLCRQNVAASQRIAAQFVKLLGQLGAVANMRQVECLGPPGDSADVTTL